MGKKEKKAEYNSLVILILSAVCAVSVGAVIGFENAVSRMEYTNNILLQRVFELQKIDKQKCIDLFMQ